MIKYILFVLFILSVNIKVFSQIDYYSDIPNNVLEHLDKMGIDSLPLLNCHECAYFNAIYEDSLKGFDLTNKKIGFLHGLNWSNKKSILMKQKKDSPENILR